MKVETSRFGIVEIPDDRVITFPEGLPGFEGNLYVLVHNEENPTVHWLQSATDPAVALLLMDPLALEPTYAINPRPQELKPIDPGDDPSQTITCRVIVRAGDKEGELYVNLFAPVLFNAEKRIAMQLPLVGSRYGVREIWPRVSGAPRERTELALDADAEERVQG
jgi:flagellar assembly factor FliW